MVISNKVDLEILPDNEKKIKLERYIVYSYKLIQGHDLILARSQI